MRIGAIPSYNTMYLQAENNNNSIKFGWGRAPSAATQALIDAAKVDETWLYYLKNCKSVYADCEGQVVKLTAKAEDCWSELSQHSSTCGYAQVCINAFNRKVGTHDGSNKGILTAMGSAIQHLYGATGQGW